MQLYAQRFPRGDIARHDSNSPESTFQPTISRSDNARDHNRGDAVNTPEWNSLSFSFPLSSLIKSSEAPSRILLAISRVSGFSTRKYSRDSRYDIIEPRCSGFWFRAVPLDRSPNSLATDARVSRENAATPGAWRHSASSRIMREKLCGKLAWGGPDRSRCFEFRGRRPPRDRQIDKILSLTDSSRSARLCRVCSGRMRSPRSPRDLRKHGTIHLSLIKDIATAAILPCVRWLAHSSRDGSTCRSNDNEPRYEYVQAIFYLRFLYLTL